MHGEDAPLDEIAAEDINDQADDPSPPTEQASPTGDPLVAPSENLLHENVLPENDPEDTQPQPAPDLPASPSTEQTAAPSQARKMRVLAAEDNKTNRLVFSKMLKNADIDLTFAENGIEAVDLYKSLAPDVVFMDISMPRMDGKEATGKIREVETNSGKHVPIIAMTAHAMQGDAEAILEAGLDYYLTKPLKKKDILERLSELAPEGVAPPV